MSLSWPELALCLVGVSIVGVALGLVVEDVKAELTGSHVMDLGRSVRGLRSQAIEVRRELSRAMATATDLVGRLVELENVAKEKEVGGESPKSDR